MPPWYVIGGVGIVFIGVIAWLGGRLLGIRQSWARGLLAALIGMAVSVLLALAVAPQNPLPYPVFFLLIIFLPALLSSMAVSGLLELLARPVPLVRIESSVFQTPHPIRAVQNWAARERRYSQITLIAARHGLGVLFQRGRGGQAPGAVIPARNLREALSEAGGVFIKLGQLLSTRSDLLPPDVIAELSLLQDNAPLADPAAIERMLTSELSKPPAEIFAEFNERPVAAASIAQVYRARLKTGEAVAVKVQRPDVAALVERDLDIMRRLAQLIGESSTLGQVYNVVELANGFATALREELDFRIEAGNIHTVTAALNSEAAVTIPKVYDEYSTARVLVTDWLDGVSVRHAGALLNRTAEQRLDLARGLLDALARQIIQSGTFHADPHPGNIFALRSGELGLLDFGSVGRIDPTEQAALRDLLYAMQRRDVVEMRIALQALAEPSDTRDEQLERALGRLVARYLAPGAPMGMGIFVELLGMLQSYGLRFPPEIGAVFRAAVTLDGTLRTLSPGFPLLDEARQLAARWVKESLIPSTLAQSAGDEIQALLPILRRLPRRLDRITEVAERGSLALKVRLFADPRDERVVSALGNRAIMAFLGAATGIISVLLLSATGGPVFEGGITLFQIMGYLGLCGGVALVMRVVIAILRDKAL